MEDEEGREKERGLVCKMRKYIYFFKVSSIFCGLQVLCTENHACIHDVKVDTVYSNKEGVVRK